MDPVNTETQGSMRLKLSGEVRMRTAVEMATNSTVYTSRNDFNELMDHSPSLKNH